MYLQVSKLSDGASGVAGSVRAEAITNADDGHWMTYQEAAYYTGWSVPYLRNLVNDGKIPVYGPPRRRRFRRFMLDLFVTNPDMAMRRFLEERENAHAG